MHRLRAVVLLLFLFGCACSATGADRVLDLTVATTHPPSLPWVYVIRDHVMPEFERRLGERRPDIEVRWLGAWGTLYKWQDSLAGVETGLADIGWIGSLWESSRLPLQNITYALPFITDDLPALMRVLNRMHDDIPALRASWRRYGAHFLGVSGVDTYHLLTTFPVRSLDDLRGRKILAPGAAAIWLKGTGAVAVDGALSSYYTQIRTGVADGVLSMADFVFLETYNFRGGRAPDCLSSADFDDNGVVNAYELSVVLARWKSGWPGGPADIDANGVVDATDLSHVIAAWGACEK